MIDLTKTIEMEKHNNKEELGFNSFDCFDGRRNISKQILWSWVSCGKPNPSLLLLHTVETSGLLRIEGFHTSSMSLCSWYADDEQKSGNKHQQQKGWHKKAVIM